MKDKEEISLHELRTTLQTIINRNKFCWICGRTDILTEHHVIPERLKGIKINLKIPVCENCKRVIHINDTIIALLKRIYLFK